MMLWDLIRDFFVHHVFGGMDSELVAYDTFLGQEANSGGSIGIDSALAYNVGISDQLSPVYMGLQDWFSTTATAISITIIVVLCCLFVYKIIRLIGGLIR